jgi:uncharacterized protein YoxC
VIQSASTGLIVCVEKIFHCAMKILVIRVKFKLSDYIKQTQKTHVVRASQIQVVNDTTLRICAKCQEFG